jgi:hypothetical protein
MEACRLSSPLPGPHPVQLHESSGPESPSEHSPRTTQLQPKTNLHAKLTVLRDAIWIEPPTRRRRTRNTSCSALGPLIHLGAESLQLRFYGHGHPALTAAETFLMTRVVAPTGGHPSEEMRPGYRDTLAHSPAGAAGAAQEDPGQSVFTTQRDPTLTPATHTGCEEQPPARADPA